MTTERRPLPAATSRSASASSIVKRSLSIAGHRTSVSLEDGFWNELRALARREGLSISGLVARIDAGRNGVNLSSALRMHVLDTLLAERERLRRRSEADSSG